MSGFETIMAITALAGAGMSATAGVKQEQARQVADNQAGRDAKKRQEMEDAAKAKMVQDETDAASLVTRDAAKRSLLARRRPDKGGTILTGALGVPNAQAPVAGKTLLGQ
jgi:NAD-dependent SIR2 family protein deacetylase